MRTRRPSLTWNALKHQLRIINTLTIVVMHSNTSAKIDAANINTSASVVMDSNTSVNIDIADINTSASVGMHENTLGKPHLECIETLVTNYKHLSDSCNAFEHVGQH